MIDGHQVVVVDPDEQIREAVGEALARIGLRAFGVTSGAAGLDAVRAHAPELVILEVELPDVSGYQVCREIHGWERRPPAIILVSTTRTAPGDRVAGLLLGADEVLAKPLDMAELIIRAGNLIRRNSAAARPYGLTNREHEVLTLLARGWAPRRIAAELVISPKTVATHIERILQKLGVHSRSEAVARAHIEALLLGGYPSPG